MYAVDDDLDLASAELRGMFAQSFATARERFAIVLASRASDVDRWASWYRANDERKWRTSLHEAGHATAAFVNGHTIRFASIVPGCRSWGRVRYIRDGSPDVDTELFGLACGPAAASVLGNQPFHLSMLEGGDGSEMKAAIWAADSRFTMQTPIERHRLYQEAIERAKQFVTDAAQPIRFLACMLAEFSILSGGKIDAVFNVDV